MISPKLKNGIIIVVTTVWAINFISGVVLPGYKPDQAINAIFMGIVGGLFALGARNKDDKPDDEQKGGGGKSSE